jgi:D-proline reductase (dithiol) PrdB
VIEKAGIPTVSTTLLTAITEKVRPPRALAIDRPLGYPLGEPDNPHLQTKIIRQALALLSQGGGQPLMVDFTP